MMGHIKKKNPQSFLFMTRKKNIYSSGAIILSNTSSENKQKITQKSLLVKSMIHAERCVI